MTDDKQKLRRRVAEALGMKVYEGSIPVRGRFGDEISYQMWTKNENGSDRLLPDWPNDAGAALALLDRLYWNAWGNPSRADMPQEHRFMIECGPRAITFGEA